MPDPIPEPEPILTDPPKSDPASNPQPSDWEKRYKGLQQAYERLQKKFEQLTLTHEQVVSELEEVRQTITTHSNEKKILTDALTKLEATKKDLEGQVASHAIDRERTKLIMSEYSDLAGFEADGLLPTAATIEELKPKLEAFRGRVKGISSAEALEKLRGTPPTGGGGNPPPARSKETVYAELTRLAGSRDPKDREQYDKLMNEWLDLNKS